MIKCLKNLKSIAFVSALTAIGIQGGPVFLKMILDQHYRLDIHGWLILAGLCLLHIALTTIPGKFGSIFAWSVLGITSLSSFLNVLNISIFRSPITIITLSTTIQSNPHEVSEFLSTYGKQMVLSAALYGTFTIALMGLYRASARPQNNRVAASALILSFIFATPTLYRSNGQLKQIAHDVHQLAYVDRLFTSMVRYRGIMEAREQAKSFWRQRNQVQRHLKPQPGSDPALPQIVVIVIGESTSRQHMGIYGYHRSTTPVLDSMKEQLIVFRDAIAPVASTLPAVIGALCSAHFNRESLECGGPTLLEIARAAGYQTTWISNQAPSGFGDNFLVELGKTADSTVFVNRDVSSAGEADSAISFDEKVLSPLDQVIQSSVQSGQKAMIFVHLMGTHFIYEKRYPKDQDIFTSTQDLNLLNAIKNKNAKVIINHYDNAIAYQDKVLGSMMQRLNSSGRDALFFYFSDHGEEVYDSDNFAGHSEDRVTPAMREVPFIVGYSQTFARKRSAELHHMRKFVARPFSTFQLTPSVAGLLGLSSDEFSQQDNVFSDNFLPDRGSMRASSSSPLGHSPHLSP